MASRPFRGRQDGHLRPAWTTKRERILYDNQQCEMWASFWEGEGRIDKAAKIRARIKPVPAERDSKPKDVSKAAPPLERAVLKEIMRALRNDPRVAQVERQQSGLFVEGNRHIRVGTPGALDIKGMLVGGRMFEIECKRVGGKPTPAQANRIAAIKASGGIAGYAWSAESALALLP